MQTICPLLISLISFNLPDKSEDTTHPAESLPRLNSDPATNAYLFVIKDLMTICTSTAIQSPVFVASPDVISYSTPVTKSVGVDIMAAIGLQNILAVGTW